jgi:hypothetical protein
VAINESLPVLTAPLVLEATSNDPVCSVSDLTISDAKLKLDGVPPPIDSLPERRLVRLAATTSLVMIFSVPALDREDILAE